MSRIKHIALAAAIVTTGLTSISFADREFPCYWSDVITFAMPGTINNVETTGGIEASTSFAGNILMINPYGFTTSMLGASIPDSDSWDPDLSKYIDTTSGTVNLVYTSLANGKTCSITFKDGGMMDQAEVISSDCTYVLAGPSGGGWWDDYISNSIFLITDIDFLTPAS